MVLKLSTYETNKLHVIKVWWSLEVSFWVTVVGQALSGVGNPLVLNLSTLVGLYFKGFFIWCWSHTMDYSFDVVNSLSYSSNRFFCQLFNFDVYKYLKWYSDFKIDFKIHFSMNYQRSISEVNMKWSKSNGNNPIIKVFFQLISNW